MARSNAKAELERRVTVLELKNEVSLTEQDELEVLKSYIKELNEEEAKNLIEI